MAKQVKQIELNAKHKGKLEKSERQSCQPRNHQRLKQEVEFQPARLNLSTRMATQKWHYLVNTVSTNSKHVFNAI